MTGRTHALGGAAAAVPVALATGQPVLVAVGLLAGLLPDLDANDSTIMHWSISVGSGRDRLQVKPFLLPAWLTSLVFRHRGFLHSLYADLLLAGILSFFLDWPWVVAVFFGYGIHLLLDGCTPAGIPLLLGRRWHFLPKVLRIHTGSYAENLVLALLAAVILAYAVPMLTNGWQFYGR